jgi:hypothetical protein
MLQVDETTTHKPLEDIDHLDLALPKIPTKALYKIHGSVVQEIHSSAYAYYTSLKLSNEDNNTLEINLNHVNFDRDETKQRIGRI